MLSLLLTGVHSFRQHFRTTLLVQQRRYSISATTNEESGEGGLSLFKSKMIEAIPIDVAVPVPPVPVPVPVDDIIEAIPQVNIDIDIPPALLPGTRPLSAPDFVFDNLNPDMAVPDAFTHPPTILTDPATGVLTDGIILAITQENIGLGAVFLIEAAYSFSLKPSLAHAKVFIGALFAAPVLFLFTNPLLSSGDPDKVTLGLEAAMATSVFVALTYLLRTLFPSPSSKEVPAFGILVCFAGFSSFAQNLLQSELVVLPSLPGLPSLPHIPLPF